MQLSFLYPSHYFTDGLSVSGRIIKHHDAFHPGEVDQQGKVVAGEQEYQRTPIITLLEKEVITTGKEKVLILRFCLSDGQRSSLLSLDYSLTDKSILNLTLPFEVENYRY